MHVLNDNTLGLTENGMNFLVNPNDDAYDDLRDLDTKIITIIASHNNSVVISDLVSYVRSAKSGLSYAFVNASVVIKTVEKLIKLGIVKYNVQPELSIYVKDNNGKKTRRSRKNS